MQSTTRSVAAKAASGRARRLTAGGVAVRCGARSVVDRRYAAGRTPPLYAALGAVRWRQAVSVAVCVCVCGKRRCTAVRVYCPRRPHPHPSSRAQYRQYSAVRCTHFSLARMLLQPHPAPNCTERAAAVLFFLAAVAHPLPPARALLCCAVACSCWSTATLRVRHCPTTYQAPAATRSTTNQYTRRR